MTSQKKTVSIIFVLTAIVFCIVFSFASCNSIRDRGGDRNDSVKQDRILLGRYLFYDRRLSVNFTRSCGTCHNPDFAFTDGYKRSLGAFADLHQRNTQPLFNLHYYKYLTAADSTLHFAVQQMKNPLFSDHPVEMGIKGHEQEILSRIKADKIYKDLFIHSFSDDKDPFSWDNVKTAISNFIYTIVSDHSAYDRYLQGDSFALTSSQKKGMALFFSPRLKCASCHGGFNFSSPSVTAANGDTLYYFNTGLYNTDGKGAYPNYDQGLYEATKNIDDMGKFRVPTLRNLFLTAPYFHDGTVADLDEVMDIYANGGREIKQGLFAGDGKTNPFKHPLITGFDMDEGSKKDIIYFLFSLTDSTFIKNPLYRNPFTEDETKKKY